MWSEYLTHDLIVTNDEISSILNDLSGSNRFRLSNQINLENSPDVITINFIAKNQVHKHIEIEYYLTNDERRSLISSINKHKSS